MSPRARSRTVSRTAVLLTVLGVALLICAAIFVASRHSKHVAGTPVVNRGTVPNYSTSAAASTTPAPATSQRASSTPPPRPNAPLSAAGAQLLIPSQHVDASIVTVAVTNHVMDVPLNPNVLGWWNAGAVPGSGHGSVVIDGHINYNGVNGALSVLPNLHPGDTVSLAGSGRSLAYRVSAVHTYSKDTGLPSDLFSQAGSERLVLITCGGPFDASTGNYEDNIVAIANPAT